MPPAVCYGTSGANFLPKLDKRSNNAEVLPPAQIAASAKIAGILTMNLEKDVGDLAVRCGHSVASLASIPSRDLRILAMSSRMSRLNASRGSSSAIASSMLASLRILMT